MIRVSIADKAIHIQEEAAVTTVEGMEYAAEIQNVRTDTFEWVHQGEKFRVEVLKYNAADKQFTLRVNGKKVLVSAKDRMDLLLEKVGLAGMNTRKVNELKSPMPGLVLDILVSEGQEIKAGEPVLILEAMKMENVLKAPADVTVKKVNAEKGKAVEKGQVLLQF